MLAQKEIGVMAHHIDKQILQHFPALLEKDGHGLRERVIQEESYVHDIYEHFYHYLKQIMVKDLSHHESEVVLKLFLLT